MLVLGQKNHDPSLSTAGSLVFHQVLIKLNVNKESMVGTGGYRVCYPATVETAGMKLPMVAKRWKSWIYSTSSSSYLWDSTVYLYAQFLMVKFQQATKKNPGFPAIACLRG